MEFTENNTIFTEFSDNAVHSLITNIMIDFKRIRKQMSRDVRKPVFGVSDQVRHRSVQPYKMARDLKFRI